MRKTEYALALASFVAEGAMIMFSLSLVYHLRLLGFDSGTIGVASGIVPLLYLTGCLAFPRLFPRFRGKVKILLSLFLMSALTILLTALRNAYSIFTCLVLYGLSQSMLWSDMETWIAGEKNGDELSKTLVLFNIAWSGSVGPATLVAGRICEKSPVVSLGTTAVMYMAAFLILLPLSSVMKEMPGGEESADDSSSRLRFPAWAGGLMVYCGYYIVLTVFPQYALDSLGISEGTAGAILLSRGVAVAVTFFLLRFWNGWQKGLLPIALPQLAFIALTALLSFFRSVASLSVLFALYGVVLAVAYNQSIFHGAQGAGARRHMRMVIHESLLTAGSVLGSAAGGFVYQYFSFRILTLSVALIFLPVTLSIILLRRHLTD